MLHRGFVWRVRAKLLTAVGHVAYVLEFVTVRRDDVISDNQLELLDVVRCAQGGKQQQQQHRRVNSNNHGAA